MKIQETKIPNVIPKIVDQSKQILAESIIQNVYPLFSEVYNGKIEEFKDLKLSLKNKKQKIVKEKNILQSSINMYKKKKKVSKLLDHIEKLIDSGLIYDGILKHETKILLKIINKLSDVKLDDHLKSTLTLINKRFSSI